MSSRPLRRGLWSATALAAAALLALAGCGTGQESPGPETDAVEHEAPAQGEQQDHDSDEADPDGQDTADDTTTEDDASDDSEEVFGSEGSRALVFIHVVAPERLAEHDGETRLPVADLAEILQGMGGPAEEPSPDADLAACESDLRYVASADVRCTVTAAFDGTEQEMTLYAHPIAAPGGAHGILYTADEPLTEDGRWAMFNGDNEATAIGMGGAYGMDPIPADQLISDMQTVIDFDFDFDHAQVDTSQWAFTVQECPGELNFDRLAPVRCTATHDETGAEHVAWALPGTFYGQEPGLIVSVDRVPAGE